MADRIKVLGRHGRVRQTGNPHEVYFQPRDEYVARMFGVMNVVEGVVTNAAVDTPFGPVDCGGLAEGSAAQVLIRPEGIVLESSGPNRRPGGTPVVVTSTHLLGHDSQETIHAFALAIRQGLDGEFLAQADYAYPTFHSDLKYLV